MKKRRRLGLAIGGFLGFGLVLVAVFFSEGILRFHYPSRSRYPVRGVDVSAHQGEIDWSVLAGQDVQFAYIKATEGSGFTDRDVCGQLGGGAAVRTACGCLSLLQLRQRRRHTGGSIHRNGPKRERQPPSCCGCGVLWGEGEKPTPSGRCPEGVGYSPGPARGSIRDQTVLYATGRAYDLYLKDAYEEHPIWIRNILTKPELPDGRNWTFWQYADRARLDGYRGEERFIDLNVFAGSEEEFQSFL